MTTHTTLFYYQNSEFLVEFSIFPGQQGIYHADPNRSQEAIAPEYEPISCVPTKNALQTISHVFKSVTSEKWEQNYTPLVLKAFEKEFNLTEWADKERADAI